MTALNQISNRISTLDSGERWTISVQDLLLSRSDFQSISVFLDRESEKGLFSVDSPNPLSSWFERTSLTITKH